MAIDEAKLNELPARSDVGTTAPPQPPIGPYRRVPVEVHQADPHAPEVARRLIALIATRWPATPAEHVGSSAVPGLAGKNIIDLLLAAEPAHIPAITKTLLELGFQPQRPAAFPPTRPMLWGTFRHRATPYRVHVHVVPAGSPEVAALRGLRDALRADPVLRRRYTALKRAIVAGGPVEPVAFTKAKHDWIAATLAHLGLADDPPRRLYQDDLDPGRTDGEPLSAAVWRVPDSERLPQRHREPRQRPAFDQVAEQARPARGAQGADAPQILCQQGTLCRGQWRR
jgi:GrpB-like predicted nucleotidyltransferase (UPF0157 family)